MDRERFSADGRETNKYEWTANKVALGIAHLKDGISTVKEHNRLIELEPGFRRQLEGRIRQEIGPYDLDLGETAIKAAIRDEAVEAVTDVKARALAWHHFGSPVERTRHYFEQSKRSRLAGSILTSVGVLAVTGAAVKGIELTPVYDLSEDAVEKLTGVGRISAITAGLMVLRPWHIATVSLARLSRRRARITTVSGLNKHSIDTTKILKDRTKHIADKGERIKERYRIITELEHKPDATSAVNNTLFDMSVTNDSELDQAVAASAASAIEWLYGESGVDVSKAVTRRQKAAVWLRGRLRDIESAVD